MSDESGYVPSNTNLWGMQFFQGRPLFSYGRLSFFISIISQLWYCLNSHLILSICIVTSLKPLPVHPGTHFAIFHRVMSVPWFLSQCFHLKPSFHRCTNFPHDFLDWWRWTIRLSFSTAVSTWRALIIRISDFHVKPSFFLTLRTASLCEGCLPWCFFFRGRKKLWRFLSCFFIVCLWHHLDFRYRISSFLFRHLHVFTWHCLIFNRTTAATAAQWHNGHSSDVVGTHAYIINTLVPTGIGALPCPCFLWMHHLSQGL